METESKIPFILLEGMDLAGKSTNLWELKKIFPNWKTTHIALSDDKTMFAVAHNINKREIWTTKEVGYLYVASILVEIDSFTWPKVPTFQDSCILMRSLAHHTAYGNKEIVWKLEELAERYTKFSEAFVFTASIKERIKRLNERLVTNPSKVNKSDRMILDTPDAFAAMDKAIVMYSKKYFNAEVLDTELLTVEETQKILVEKITTTIRTE